MWLATMDREGLEQAALSRAVSTAYYAVFHLLTSSGAQLWIGSGTEQARIERAFDHGSMRKISAEFANRKADPRELRDIADTFVDLQIERQSADYDNQRVWSQTEVLGIVEQANDVFAKWEIIRTHPKTGSYLLAMLLGKQR